MKAQREREVRRAEPLSMFEQVFPSDLNHHGTMFGGRVVALMDMAAGMCVGRWSNRTPVTACIDAIQFGTPIHQGQMVEIRARIVHVGCTSCIVSVTVSAHDMHSGDDFFCCEGFFSMVSIDAHGKPVVLPLIPVETEDEKLEWAKGAQIRERMIQQRQKKR
jgi:acyl-CoA hydrolase